MSEFKQGGHFDSLYEAGAKMGFAKGGVVKDTGNMPAIRGDSQQEIEAGGRAKTSPGYKHGGKVMSKKDYMMKHGGSTKGYGEYRKKMMKGGKMEDGYMEGGHAKVKANKKMPKNVKMKGGLAHASKYARDGKMKHGGPYRAEPMYGKK